MSKRKIPLFRAAAMVMCMLMLASACTFAAGEPVGILRIDSVDFGNTDGMVGVILTALPENGGITLNGRACMRGEGISIMDMEAVRYEPDSMGESSFSYLPVYAEGGIGEARTVMLSASENTAPIACSASFETYRNMLLGGTLTGTDPDGESLTVEIMERPEMGTIAVDADTGAFVYTPYQNRVGTDRFTFCLTDESGGVSAAAEVTIRVARPQSGLEYEDMKASTAQYAAVRLAELGVYEGPKVGNLSYFEPEQEITRAEFVSMAVALAEMDVVPAGNTGFADNEAIPVWARPFAAAALQSGMIEGDGSDGIRSMRADDGITRAEAAVILCAAAGISDAAEVEVFADDGAIPAWAKSAVVNANEMGLLKGTEAGFAPNAVLNREEAAEALYAAYCEREKNIIRTGFFSWIL